LPSTAAKRLDSQNAAHDIENMLNFNGATEDNKRSLNLMNVKESWCKH